MNKNQFIILPNLTFLKDKKIIGIDETGVGDYFGPIVSCAAFIPLKNIENVKALGIKDSKKISDKKILKISDELSKLVYYSIHHLSPQGYNSLNKIYNSNELKMFSHLNAIQKLQERLEIDYIFIDQYSTLNSIEKYYETFMSKNWANLKPFKTKVLLSTKAEDIDLSVAVASVLARGYFLRYMRDMNEKYNIEFPLGAGKKVKEFVQEFNKKNSIDTLNKVAKMHFKINK